MLYTRFGMQNKPNLPDEIWLGTKEYSWRSDLHVNGWLLVATLISAFGDVLYASTVSQWSLLARTVVVLAQFMALALWVRSLRRWIRGMDEMHRRVAGGAVLCAVGATFFFVMLWHRLDVAGLFRAMFPGRGNWDIATVTHAFLLMTFFYFTSYSVLSRRYQ